MHHDFAVDKNYSSLCLIAASFLNSNSGLDDIVFIYATSSFYDFPWGGIILVRTILGELGGVKMAYQLNLGQIRAISCSIPLQSVATFNSGFIEQFDGKGSQLFDLLDSRRITAKKETNSKLTLR